VRPRGHRCEIRFRHAAAKSFDDDVGGVSVCRHRRNEPAHAHVAAYLVFALRIEGGRDSGERGAVVDPQCHGTTMFVGELLPESPADSGVAEMIDDAAEYIVA